MGSDAVVRRVGADEWALLRDVRLRALADSPDAFGSTLERESGYADDDWSDWAAHGASGGESATFVAEAGARSLGMLIVAREQDDTAVAHLYGMWVEPGARRLGLGRRLIAAAERWAAVNGCLDVRLWVVVDNVPAVDLYRSVGYADTGTREPLDRDPSFVMAEFRKALGAG